jgi:hypothetical protein
MDIYQEIWNADQQHCGLKALKKAIQLTLQPKTTAMSLWMKKKLTTKIIE